MSSPLQNTDTAQNSGEDSASALPTACPDSLEFRRIDDSVERGFLLAHFIVPDRITALTILIRAMNKLKTKCAQEGKRKYWRDKFLKRQITRVTRDEEDTLQWLIYFESDAEERQEEERGAACQEDLVVRYVKTLVRLSTAMSSFYVNIAIHRLLYCYTTSEAQRIYEFVADTYRESDEYRRGKRWLALRIEERFRGLLRSIKLEHGETRFAPAERQELWVPLVRECLEHFTPWSTLDTCPLKDASNRSYGRLHESLNSGFHTIANQDKIEVNRCHVFIDPVCSGHIARALQLGQHSSRLGVPRFYMNSDPGRNPPSSRLPQSSLTGEERQHIAERLSAEQSRRKGTVARACTFVVDGVERARMEMDRNQELRFEVPSGSQLFEVWTNDTNGPLLLATHLLKPSGSGEHERFRVSLQSLLSLEIRLTRGKQVDSNTDSFTVRVEQESNRSQIATLQQRLLHGPALPAYAGMLLLCIALAMSWVAYKKTVTSDRSETAAVTDKIAREEVTKSSSVSGHLSATASYRLTPDDMIARGGNQTETNAVVVPSSPTLIRLDLPIDNVGPRYSALLTRLGGRECILIETDLLAARQSNRAEVKFAVPSTLLAPGQYYRIELHAGRPSISRTFTFYTTPQR